MTWFKSLIMRQNSPMLLIDANVDNNHYSNRERPRLTASEGARQISGRKMARQVRLARNLIGENSLAGSEEFVSLFGSEEEKNAGVTAHICIPTKCTRESHQQQIALEDETIIKTNTAQIDQRSAVSFHHHPLPQLVSSQAQSGRLPDSNERDTSHSSSRQDHHQQNMITGSGAQEEDVKKKRRTATSFQFSHLLAGNIKSPMSLTVVCLLLLITLATRASLAISQSQQYFDAQPEPQYFVGAGHDVRLRCLIRNRQGECMWLRNGRNIGPIKNKYQFQREPLDGDCSLMIRNVTVAQDDASWSCQVTATSASSDLEQDSLQSRDVKLVVLVAPERPQIKNMTQGNTQPKVILEEYKTKSIICEMRGGNPAPQIEWLLDNKNITKEANQTSTVTQNGATGQRITQSRLRLNDIKRTMNGKNLTCVGVHQTINQSTSVELDVQCKQTSATAAPPISLPTKPGPVLEFDSITREFNQNIFECLAQNTYGVSLPADVKLNVLYAPFLLNTSHSQHVLVGSNASLSCLFEGNPEPEIRWHYADPLSRSSAAVQLDTVNGSGKNRQHLNITNVSYRNEGEYHCEARNRINGFDYSVRSSSMILDVYGEPQFLVKSPVQAKAVQGSKSDISLTFCSDPAPNKVVWQFGSLKLEPSLPNVNNGQQPLPAAAQLPPGGSSGGLTSRQGSIHKRFHPHPLHSVQKRNSNFSQDPTCFEAVLSLLDPELTDQRDYTLIVQNERGFQTGTVRLRVSSPLSPAIMITSAFLTICGLFLCSLLVMFVKRRNTIVGTRPGSSRTQGSSSNGELQNGTSKVKPGGHLVNGNGVANAKQQQTRGHVNGAGNGLANGASNPAALGNKTNQGAALLEASPGGSDGGSSGDGARASNMISMASSDTCSGDQKQLLASSSDGASSPGSSPVHHHHHHGAREGGKHLDNHSQQSVDAYAANGLNGGRSTANSTPTPMNHISVDDEIQLGSGPTYQAGESITSDAQLSPGNSTGRSGRPGIMNVSLYANLDYHQQPLGSMGSRSAMVPSPHPMQQQFQPTSQHAFHNNDSQSRLMSLASNHNAGLDNGSLQRASHQNGSDNPLVGPRPSVGATIAMMNSLAAAAAGNLTDSPGSGALNGAINQQLNGGATNRASSNVIRKPGPPKPPKPSVQQRSRFYQQQMAAAQQRDGGLVMIGSTGGQQYEDAKQRPPTSDLAAEYSKISFAARAEL